jgi:hypothetical protein
MEINPNFESIDISVTLSSSFWKDAPKIKVYIDEELLYNGEVTEPKEIKWTGNLMEGEHIIAVELYQKDKYQTIIEDNKIIKDQVLNIDTITFDEIDIGHLTHILSNYYPDKNFYGDDIPSLAKNCINLGWNGRWELKFTTPIYIWLLENI